ncbi:MAG: cytochrome c biogenesis protein CcsA [Armatimonadota bacterium]
MYIAGNLLLACAALAALAASLLGGFRPAEHRKLRRLQWILAPLSLAVLGILAWLVYAGDPNTVYAAEHAAPVGSPVGYRIAAVWAGQAGGLLLWSLETVLISLLIRPNRQPRTVAVLSAIQSSLLLVSALGNPFRQGTAPSPGLNPLLMHPMMLIHPPMLFLGYALLSVPFAITMEGLISREMGPWAARLRPWVLAPCLALTIGNGFGASWAYRTFGWGGFWSWDPVENTSFVPWLLALATVHGIWLSRFSTAWLRITAACSLFGFISVLYGSFLVRSGLLANASVHAYAGGESLLKWALALLLVGGTISSTFLAASRWRGMRAEHQERPRHAAPVSWGNIAMLVMAMLVLAGMTLSAFGLSPTPALYNLALMPFSLFAGLMLASAQLAGFRRVGPGLSHIGLALFMSGVLTSGLLSSENRAFITVGTSKSVAGHSVELLDLEAKSNVLRSDIAVDGRRGHMEMERNPAFNILLRRAWIIRRPFEDLYITPLAANPSGIMLDVSAKPGISLVWAGIVLMALGIGWSMSARRRSTGGEG